MADNDGPKGVYNRAYLLKAKIILFGKRTCMYTYYQLIKTYGVTSPKDHLSL